MPRHVILCRSVLITVLVCVLTFFIHTNFNTSNVLTNYSTTTEVEYSFEKASNSMNNNFAEAQSKENNASKVDAFDKSEISRQTKSEEYGAQSDGNHASGTGVDVIDTEKADVRREEGGYDDSLEEEDNSEEDNSEEDNSEEDNSEEDNSKEDNSEEDNSEEDNSEEDNTLSVDDDDDDYYDDDDDDYNDEKDDSSENTGAIDSSKEEGNDNANNFKMVSVDDDDDDDDYYDDDDDYNDEEDYSYENTGAIDAADDDDENVDDDYYDDSLKEEDISEEKKNDVMKPGESIYPIESAVASSDWEITLGDGKMYELVGNKMDHDKTHFTQGLTYSQSSDTLFESVGLYDKSQVCKLNATTGVTILCKAMDSKYFAEGMQVYGDAGHEKLIQITWREKTGFIYDALSLELIRKFQFTTTRNEGWGICLDDSNDEFIVSDGSAFLHFWDVETLEEKRKLKVTRQTGKRADELNELTFMNGKILANVWYEDVLLVIDPHTGKCEKEYGE